MNELLILADTNCLICYSERMMDGHTGVWEILDMRAVVPSTMTEFYHTYCSIKLSLHGFPMSDKNLEVSPLSLGGLFCFSVTVSK